MGETVTVRDHSRPCEQGSQWPHWIVVSKARWWQEPDCLGCKAMTLRRVDEQTWEEVDGGGEPPATGHPAG